MLASDARNGFSNSYITWSVHRLFLELTKQDVAKLGDRLICGSCRPVQVTYPSHGHLLTLMLVRA